MAAPRGRAQWPRALALVLAITALASSAGAQNASNPVLLRTTEFDELVGNECTVRADCGQLPGLACVRGLCQFCRHDDDCNSRRGATKYRCRRPPAVSSSKEAAAFMGRNAVGELEPVALCVEKDLFDPFTWHDVLATVLAFLSTALGSGCGVGGGGLLVPAFILVIGLSPKHAIPLSKATIFGNALAIYLFNVKRKHPLKPNVPIINYPVAAIMEPTTLIGAVFGVMMNHVFPTWLINFLLISLLAFITKKTYNKGNKIHDKESQHNAALIKAVLKGRKGGGGRGRAWSIYRHFDWKVAARRWLSATRRNRKLRAVREQDEEDFKSLPPLALASNSVTSRLLEGKQLRDASASAFGTFNMTESVSDDTPKSILRRQIERKEASVFPLKAILPLAIAWLIVFGQTLLRGGHGVSSVIGVQCSTFEYWLLTLLPIGVLVVITWRVGYWLRLDNRLRVISGYDFLDSDIHWTWPRVTKFPFYCIAAGVAAGLLGIGGGMVKGPIMLEMGVLPPVQSATASYMILYTSSSTTLQFAIAGQFPGQLQYDYVGWFAFVGFLGGLCGQKVVAFLVKKYKRESIVVYILAGTIGLSAVCMGYVGIRSTVNEIRRGASLGFHSLCGRE